jgi:hypothetical protein
MRSFSVSYRFLITLVVALAGVALLYYLPISRSLTNSEASPSPTATPDYSGWKSYLNQKFGISLKYPPSFKLVPGRSGPLAEWQLYGLTSGTEIVSIEIPSSFQIRTNLIGAVLRVGLSSDPTAIKECLNPPEEFGYKNAYIQRKIGGVVFRKFTRSEGAAGNFYDFTSYRAIRDGGCEVFEYSIHKTNLENYPIEARRKEFNLVAVTNALESILDTVQFVK